jgi:hypothetical protein
MWKKVAKRPSSVKGECKSGWITDAYFEGGHKRLSDASVRSTSICPPSGPTTLLMISAL